MDIGDIRRARLKEWFTDRPRPQAEKSYLSQLIHGKATFGEKAARRLEKAHGMPPNFLDTPLSDKPAAPPLSDEHARLIAAWELLKQDQRQQIFEQIMATVEDNLRTVREIGPTVRVRERELQKFGRKPFVGKQEKAHEK